MARIRSILSILVFFSGCYLLTTLHLKNILLQPGFVFIHKAITRQIVKQTHTFIPANHTSITFTGRWILQPKKARIDTGFEGSQLSFTVCNSTSIYLSLANELKSRDLTTRKETHVKRLAVLPHNLPIPAGPVSLLARLNDTALLFNNTGYGILRIAENLDKSRCYQVILRYIGGKEQDVGILNLNGICLSSDGFLTPKSLGESTGGNIQHLNRSDQVTEGHDTITEQTVELFLSISNIKVLKSSDESNQTIPNMSLGFPEFLEGLSPSDLRVTAISIPPNVCLTRKCKLLGHYDNTNSIPTAPDLFFRSGPPSTPYYHRPWSYNSIFQPPSILILEIGFYDFLTFLSTPEHHNKATLDTFITHFVNEFVRFILNIRRNLPHHQRNTPTTKQRQTYIDDSYLYNSQPSALPIFLMLPPLPSTYDETLTKALFHATSQIIHILQTTEGDKSTSMIDTSGWFSNTDFSNMTISTIDPTNKRANINHSIPILTTQAHRIFASFIYLHICPYLTHNHNHNNNNQCPFNKQIKYEGNLYIPDEAMIGKILEEKKIEKLMKKVFPMGMGL